MTGKHIWKNVALGAILALTAVPALAQERDSGGPERMDRGERGGMRGGWGGGERGQAPQQAQPQFRPQVQAQPQMQAPPQVQGMPPQARGWTGNGGGGNWQRGNDGDRGGNRGGNGGWGGGNWRGQAQAMPQPAPQAVPPQQSVQPQWQGRNRSYVDQSRNDGFRNDNRQWRGDRDGNRDGNRGDWRGNGNWNQNRGWDGNRGDWNRNNNWNNNRNWNGNRGDWNRNNTWNNNRGWNGNGRWNNGWRNDRRYDWQAWRFQNRNVFRAGRYYSPYRGYGYSRIGIGFTLNSLFFGSNYWIDDPFAYHLPPAYGPYRWVRYFDDVLLVDIYSGEVVDVVYDFFW